VRAQDPPRRRGLCCRPSAICCAYPTMGRPVEWESSAWSAPFRNSPLSGRALCAAPALGLLGDGEWHLAWAAASGSVSGQFSRRIKELGTGVTGPLRH
jgi:hypothetical protein